MRRPAFSYYGAKFRLGRHYPAPMHDTIIEPFAGAAGYSMHWWDRDVILIDLDEHIAGVWRYLIESSLDDIRALPLIGDDTNIRQLDIPRGAKWLIGFWSGCGPKYPRNTPSKWHKSTNRGRNKRWSEATRDHVAMVCDRVSHWRIIHGDYSDSPDLEATWFIDPPYSVKGHHYRCGSRDIDYSALAEWCRARRGQVMVCEQDGADWMDFEPFRRHRSTWRPETGERTATEVWWTNGNPWPQTELCLEC